MWEPSGREVTAVVVEGRAAQAESFFLVVRRRVIAFPDVFHSCANLGPPGQCGMMTYSLRGSIARVVDSGVVDRAHQLRSRDGRPAQDVGRVLFTFGLGIHLEKEFLPIYSQPFYRAGPESGMVVKPECYRAEVR